VSRCALDTDVVIAALDRRDRHHVEAAQAIRRMSEDGVVLLLSLVNYAEALVRPAEDESALRTARDALAALEIRLIAPTSTIAVNAARHRRLNISLADGFAIATAQSHDGHLATFDHRVRRALPKLGVKLTPQLS
jgi:predicted nucleic acid-binding protein